MCEHRPEWIRQRDDGDIYCTVCRSIFEARCEGFHYEWADQRICQTWGSSCPDLKEIYGKSIRQGRGTPTEQYG